MTTPTLGIHVVWCSRTLAEKDWIRFLLGDLILSEETCLDLTVAKPNSLYVIDCNKVSIADLPGTFLDSLDSARPVGLFHCADEWYAGGYSSYRHFDYVLRTHHASYIRGEGIKTLPLGWPNGTLSLSNIRPASERKFLWSFVGNVIATRPEMLKALENLTPRHVQRYRVGESRKSPLGRVEFMDLLNESTFCPAPMGNVMAETWRFYEALEAGSIPIVERHGSFDYYRRLFGPHPIPTFSNWAAARRYIQHAASNPERLNALQTEIMKWWALYKQSLSREARQFVVAGLQGEFRTVNAHLKFPHPAILKGRQYVELLRHHSLAAAIRRVRKGLMDYVANIRHDPVPSFRRQ